MPQGSFSSNRPYSTPSRRKPRNMSVSGSPVIGILDEWSSIMGFLAWKLQGVTSYVALQPNVAPQTNRRPAPWPSRDGNAWNGWKPRAVVSYVALQQIGD